MYRSQHIPTSTAPLPFTPPSVLEALFLNAEKSSDDTVDQTDAAQVEAWLKTAGVDAPVFLVKPMTEAEFDRLGYELFRHNLVPPSQDSYRALLIDEIFELFGDEEGEAKATLMDQYWQSEDVYQQQMAEWHEQDRQRMLDEQSGGEPRKPMPLPQKLLGLRDRNKGLLLAEEVRMKSAKIRDMTIEMQSYEPIQRAGLARLVLLGWSGLETEFLRVDGIVPQETYDALRAEIGKDAIRELETFVASLGTLSETERGNSESPPLTEQIQPSSPAPAGETDSAGASMSAEASTLSSSSSEATLGDESEATTGELSTSTSPSPGTMESIADTPAEA